MVSDPDYGKFWWQYSCGACGYKREGLLNSEWYSWSCPQCSGGKIVRDKVGHVGGRECEDWEPRK